MKVECLPRPLIQLTFEYEELKTLITSIEFVVTDNRYKNFHPGTQLDNVVKFLQEINKVI